MTETKRDALQSIDPNELAAETTLYKAYLAQMGLPTDNIIATTEERKIVVNNLPSFLQSLPLEEKRDARYLSKFVGATAVGLFDAALNYVWNEVVLNLRKKVSIYGVELFFDAAVGGKNRDLYKDESDLEGLKDIVLLDTCRKLELISDVVYMKLDHILTMRNEVAASHPNVASIGGFELLGWLQTCVKDVLQDSLSESAIRIRSLVGNLTAMTSVIDDAMKERFATELRNLSLPHLHNLLLTFFGIFVAPATDQILRNNVSKLAPAIWNLAEDSLKYRIGATIDGYRTNLQQDKLDLGIQFLQLVDGKVYETLPARTVALQNLAIQLMDAHVGWDNYYHEPPVMREILSYCKRSTDIPKELLPTLTRIVLSCRIGRGLTFREGVSPGGKPLYDKFFSLLDDDGVSNCLANLFAPEINPKLRNQICQNHLSAILLALHSIAISDRLKQAVIFLQNDLPNAWRANSKKDFQVLTTPFIVWR